MNKLITLFSNKYIYLSAGIIFVFFLIVILPDQGEKAAQYIPENGSFDTAFYYSPQSVSQKIAAYGDAGRRAYIRNRWTFDLVYPFVYGIFLFSSISFSIRRLKWKILQKNIWAIIPLIAVLFDFMENSFVSILMYRYPVQMDSLTYGASIATQIKWLFAYASVALAIIFPLLLGITALIDYMIRRKRIDD